MTNVDLSVHGTFPGGGAVAGGGGSCRGVVVHRSRRGALGGAHRAELPVRTLLFMPELVVVGSEAAAAETARIRLFTCKRKVISLGSQNNS